MRDGTGTPGAGRMALRPLLYLLGIALAELIVHAGSSAIAVAVYAAILVVSLNAAARQHAPESALSLGIAVVALERPLSLAFPLVGVGILDSWVLLAVPTLIGILLAARLAKYARRDLGLVIGRLAGLASLALIPVGLVVGFLSYELLRPALILGDQTLGAILPLVLGLAFATGIVEELLFRGLLQRAASERLGTVAGILYVGFLYTALALTPGNAPGVLLVFVTAIALGAITRFTRSVIPAMAAHASLNVGLLVVAPLVARGGTLS